MKKKKKRTTENGRDERPHDRLISGPPNAGVQSNMKVSIVILCKNLVRVMSWKFQSGMQSGIMQSDSKTENNEISTKHI